MEKILEKWTGEVAEVIIGATVSEGGSRDFSVKVGGGRSLPGWNSENGKFAKPIVVAEVMDFLPIDLWPLFYSEYKEVVTDMTKWIKEVEKAPIDGLCVRLNSSVIETKEDYLKYVDEIVGKVLSSTRLPLIFLGSGDIEVDKKVLPLICKLTKGEKILVGMVEKENYREIVSSIIENGHSLITQSPLDINLAKQLNILVNDMGVPLNRIVMHHTTAGLGYGLEYCYSIMERCRLSALQGDRVLSSPMINLVSEETWKIRESKVGIDEEPTWGEPLPRSINWELTTAIAYFYAGSDILVLSHPESIKRVKKFLQKI